MPSKKRPKESVFWAVFWKLLRLSLGPPGVPFGRLWPLILKTFFQVIFRCLHRLHFEAKMTSTCHQNARKNGFGATLKNSASCKREPQNQGFGGPGGLQKLIPNTSGKTIRFLLDLIPKKGAKLLPKCLQDQSKKVIEKWFKK